MPAQVSVLYRAPETAPFSMIKVEGGPFSMGGEQYDDEKPVHTVQVQTFWIGQYPVT
ncbi:MAG: SUMF1/EgtB/PvdO family nonheme iron enzyme [Phaeodactylibacter sp.]|nr:SUMF1/EgtB/PvdO family nonheme iron enzyme [Phaeodactylibacter sp.]